MLSAALIADLTISISAALGLLVVRAQIAPGPDGLTWRFRTILFVTAFFYVLRAIDWLTAFGPARTLTIIAAALIPFAALLLAEGMLRRHAPRPVKIAAAIGLALCALGALIPDFTRSPTFLIPFLVYQALLFAAGLSLLLTRNRSEFTPPENAMIDRIALSVPIILVLLLTDYQLFGRGLIPALSGLAALVVAWIASTLEARAASGAYVGAALLAIAAISGVAGLTVGAQTGFPPGLTLQVAAIVMALVLLLVVGLSSAALQRARVRASLDEALTQTASLKLYRDAITRLGLTEGYALLSGDDLRDYDATAVIDAIGPTGSVVRAELPKSPGDDTLGQSQIRALLDRFATREVALVAKSPFTLAVGTPSGLADGSSANIRAAFAVARLIAERDATP
ncbi:hypothetical protein V8J82_00180 [Gymnodinialimonas sp. 2305UL16-5]|uniref:hypothetical protein n=1 Tax=Gymnodinialimonas mytili TaxID=3126503 RepID=UPI0030ABA8FB